MTTYMIIGVSGVLCRAHGMEAAMPNSPKPQDSALNSATIFNPNEQLTLTRLKEVLPDYIVLAHASMMHYLPPNLVVPRHKVSWDLIADFVILDQQYQIAAIVAAR